MWYTPIERDAAVLVSDLVLSGLHAAARTLDSSDRDPASLARLFAGVRDTIADAIRAPGSSPAGTETNVSRESMRFMAREAIRRTAALKVRIAPPDVPYDPQRTARTLAATFIDMNIILHSPSIAAALAAETEERGAP